MAYPSLIRKILDLQNNRQSSQNALLDLSGQTIRVSNRVARLEVERAESDMSLEELSRKVKRLEEDNQRLNLSNIMLARQVMEMSDMLVHAVTDGKVSVTITTGNNGKPSPFGYLLPTGETVAPIVLADSKPDAPRGALTAVISAG